MGVMQCHRKDCENIMCDLYIEDIGYVCYECQSEFKAYLKEMNEDEEGMKHREIKARLKHFMKTSFGSYTEEEDISVDDFFREYNEKEYENFCYLTNSKYGNRIYYIQVE